MTLHPSLVLASAAIGLLVGLTGAGGGALMTPMLIVLFGVKASAAISSDLVAALFMRPFGGAVHWRRGSVNLSLVRWLALGSVPAAFAGAFLLHLAGGGAGAQQLIERLLGVALLLGGAGMLARESLRRRSSRRVLTATTGGVAATGGGTGAGAGTPRPAATLDGLSLRRLRTVATGALGGLLVGSTSVGAGSLMVVLLLSIYPGIGASELVGTDLVQAIPLTAAAALGQLVFGHVEMAVTASLVAGSVPGVLVGSLLSSRAPELLVRAAVTVVVIAAGLEYVGLTPAALVGVAAVVALYSTVPALREARVRWRRIGAVPGAAPRRVGAPEPP